MYMRVCVILLHSVFYVYYEQYLTIKEDVAINLGISLGLSFYIIRIEELYISPHASSWCFCDVVPVDGL